MKTLGATHFLGCEHIVPIVKPRGMRYVAVMHDVVHIVFPQTMKRTNRWVSSVLFAGSYRRADHLIAVSESTRDDLVKFLGPRDITVVYPGGDNFAAAARRASAV